MVPVISLFLQGIRLTVKEFDSLFTYYDKVTRLCFFSLYRSHGNSSGDVSDSWSISHVYPLDVSD